MGLFNKNSAEAQKSGLNNKAGNIKAMSFESPSVVFISSGYDAHGNIAALNFIALVPDVKNGIKLTSIHPKNAVEFFKKYPVCNLKLGSDKEPFIGTNGVFGRYPKIGRGINHAKNECKYVVLCKDTIGRNFLVSDASGKFGLMSDEQAINYATMFGFANGKVVEKDGKKFLSAIAGEYPVVKMTFNPEADGQSTAYKMYRKALAAMVGEERADFIIYSQVARHIGNAELYAWAMEETANKEDPNDRFGYGIGLVGCMIYAKDKKDGVKDEKLIELLSKIVEPDALKIIDKIVEKGWDFTTVWDYTPVKADVAAYRKAFGLKTEPIGKYDITRQTMAMKFENYDKHFF